jgi:hypothetical protein
MRDPAVSTSADTAESEEALLERSLREIITGA